MTTLITKQKRTLLLSLLLLFQLNLLFGQLEEGRRITETLCSEKYFGRGYIKSGDSLAAVFLEEEFARRGLKKIKKSFLQPFRFDVNTFPGAMELTINGQKLKPAIDFLVDENSGSSKSDWKFKQLTPEEIFDLNATRNVVGLIRKKEIQSIVIDITGLKGDSLKKARGVYESFSEICNVLVLTDQKFTFSVGSNPLPFALVFVQKSSVGAITSIRANIENIFKKQHLANNVVALLPAQKKSKEYIVFTAHYDHLGGMGAQTYFPGANDNASGTSMLFALADYFKEHPSPYNILFIAFAGEEAGLIGSKYFTDHPLIDLKNIKFLLNLDIMGSGEEGITVVNATLFPEAFEKLNDINKEQQLLTQIKKRGPAANSDHYWFTEKGVPAFFIYTMGENKNYHDVQDTYEALSFKEYVDIVQLISAFVQKL